MAVFAVSHLSLAEPLSIVRKAEISLVQEKAMTRAVLGGVAGGVAVGVGVGFAFRQMMCRNGNCPKVVETVVPSLLVGGVVGAGVGAFMRQLVGHDTSFIVYPTVGIGSYSAAPALMFEGRF